VEIECMARSVGPGRSPRKCRAAEIAYDICHVLQRSITVVSRS
jgi:hypothetical protein